MSNIYERQSLRWEKVGNFKTESDFFDVEVVVDFSRLISLAIRLSPLIILPVDRGAMALFNPLAGNIDHAPVIMPLPVHDADTVIVIIFRAAAALSFIYTIRRKVETAPPASAMIELRPAGSPSGASHELPVSVMAEAQ